jgi:BirA family biotin operon repressor/biotin-[acetyl-CoA-carboxylase] ligase
MTPVFSTQHIAALCSPAARHVGLSVVAETGSTNADLLARLPTLDAPALLIAEQQTAGRGRAGRTWHSAAGAGLTFSLAWRFRRPIQEMVGLPLAVGVAIAEALAAQSVLVQLKWPNDILRNGKKLGGILIATSNAEPLRNGTTQTAQTPQANWAVIGIGLNLAMTDQLEAQIGHPVADAPWLAQMDRNILLAAFLNHLVDAMHAFEQDGLTTFIPRWHRFHAHAGRNVKILDQGRTSHQGRALGIDTLGRLLLETAQGPVAVLAGDVSLREDPNDGRQNAADTP